MTEAPRGTLADRWLERGARAFDATPSLAVAAKRALSRRESPSRWMRSALSLSRGEPVATSNERDAAIDRSLARKYARATAAAIGAGCASVGAGFSLTTSAVLAAIAFYVAEVQRVFVVLAALDGAPDPTRESRALIASQGGLGVALIRVLRIAAHMLTGGFRGLGFVRSWCVGCLAVVYWYEYARVSADRSSRERDTWSARHA